MGAFTVKPFIIIRKPFIINRMWRETSCRSFSPCARKYFLFSVPTYRAISTWRHTRSAPNAGPFFSIQVVRPAGWSRRETTPANGRGSAAWPARTVETPADDQQCVRFPCIDTLPEFGIHDAPKVVSAGVFAAVFQKLKVVAFEQGNVPFDHPPETRVVFFQAVFAPTVENFYGDIAAPG